MKLALIVRQRRDFVFLSFSSWGCALFGSRSHHLGEPLWHRSLWVPCPAWPWPLWPLRFRTWRAWSCRGWSTCRSSRTRSPAGCWWAAVPSSRRRPCQSWCPLCGGVPQWQSCWTPRRRPPTHFCTCNQKNCFPFYLNCSSDSTECCPGTTCIRCSSAPPKYQICSWILLLEAFCFHFNLFGRYSKSI